MSDHDPPWTAFILVNKAAINKIKLSINFYQSEDPFGRPGLSSDYTENLDKVGLVEGAQVKLCDRES